MKKIFKILTIISLMTVTMLFAPETKADAPPPPQDHGESGNQPAGGGAPIGGGLILLVAMGLGYGARKVYSSMRNSEE